ncbi:MAG: GNAT family N-acetyltransferase [Gemmatimonadales bacterium]
MKRPNIEIRELRTIQEYEECVALQRATWGESFREVVAPAMLMVTQKVGGVTAGAFDEAGDLVGFVYGVTGIREGRPAHWSHMLAVREDLRDMGIGRRLKLYQRDRLRELGIDRMYWTFDPLVARNANLNLNKLGARVVEYVPDMYGQDLMSLMDRVIGTDRFVVEWPLDAPQGEPKEAAAPSPDAPLVTADPAKGEPYDAAELPTVQEVLVEIPEDIASIQATDPEAALFWRRTTRRALQHYLGKAYRVAGFMPRGRGAGGRRSYVVREVSP